MPKSKEEQELDDLLTDMLLEIRSTGNEASNQTSNPNSNQDSKQNSNPNKSTLDDTAENKENLNVENQSSEQMLDSSQTSAKQLCGGGRPASGHLANDEQPVGSPRFLKKPSYEGQESNQATAGQPFSYGIQTASPALQRRRLLSERTAYVSESDPNQENRSASDRRSEENLIALLQQEAAEEPASNRQATSSGEQAENLDWLERQKLKLKNRREGELWRDRFSKERSLMQELRNTVKPKQHSQFDQPLHIDTGANQSINIPIDRSISSFDQRYQRSQSANYDGYPGEDPEFRTVNTKKKTMQKGLRGDRSGSSTPVRPSTPTNQRSQSPAPSISSLAKRDAVHATNLPVREEHRPVQQSVYGTIVPISRAPATNIPISRSPANSSAPLAASSPKPVDETDLAELIHTASSPVYAHSRPTSSARTVSRQSNETQPTYRTHQPQIYAGYQSTPIRVRFCLRQKFLATANSLTEFSAS